MSSGRDGILVVDKDVGPTSHDVVAGLRSVLGQRRVGHCGTLDPLATGVLVACLGAYTRLSQWISDADKEYETTIQLGATSTTGDVHGQLQGREDAVPPSPEQLAAAISGFVGEIEQVPPAFSAIKINGVPSYKLARADRSVELHPRSVSIFGLEVVSYDYPILRLQVSCSKGTYIRSLAADLGEALKCGGYVRELRRTRVGALTLAQAVSLEEIRAATSDGRIERLMVPPRAALCDMPEVILDAERVARFAHGNPVRQEPDQGVSDSDAACAVYDPQLRLCGIGSWNGGAGLLRPLKVLRSATVAMTTVSPQ